MKHPKCNVFLRSNDYCLYQDFRIQHFPRLPSFSLGTTYEDLEGKANKSFALTLDLHYQEIIRQSVCRYFNNPLPVTRLRIIPEDLLSLTEQIFISLDFCSTFYQEKVEGHALAKDRKPGA